MNGDATIRRRWMSLALAAAVILAVLPGTQAADKPWSFLVVSDPEPHKGPEKGRHLDFYNDLLYLKKIFVTQATADRPAPAFILVPGDVAPVDATDREFQQALGDKMLWLPVPGNHDLGSGERKAMAGIIARGEPLGVRAGPPGAGGLQYHFAFNNATFVGLDLYWDGKDRAASAAGGGPLADKNLQWLKGVLAASDSRYKIVFAHRPAWPFYRHADSTLAEDLDGRDRFWQALADGGCQLYLCGHTHYYGAYRWLGNDDPGRWKGYRSKLIPEALGVWQVNAGCFRGPKIAYDRVIVYFKVTDECMEAEARVAKRGADGDDAWQTPPNDQTNLYCFRIFPDLKANLPAGAKAKLPATAPAAAIAPTATTAPAR